MKFMVIASDVIYPAGAMRDYEDKFYLPFKGFRKPIYAIPGNHDWFDALEGFIANLLEPMPPGPPCGPGAPDHLPGDAGGTQVEAFVAEAERLRREYGSARVAARALLRDSCRSLCPPRRRHGDPAQLDSRQHAGSPPPWSARAGSSRW